MSLWIDLLFEFERAFERQDTSLVDSIIKYAKYSISAKNDDLLQAVACAFLEHLPCNPKIRIHIPKWFSAKEFEELREIFAYHAGAEVVEEIRKSYRAIR
jgi:hypothetical protein